MPYPMFLAGMKVTAARLSAGRVEYVTNTVAQNNTLTTFVDATGLGFPIEANSQYLVHAFISYNAPPGLVNGEVNFQWTGAVDTTTSRHVFAPALSQTTNIDTNAMSVRRALGTDVRVGGTTAPGTSNAFTVYEDILDVTVVTAGTLQLQFALGVGVGTATVQADSMIWYQRVA